MSDMQVDLTGRNLAAAVRFVDGFTQEPVCYQYSVSIQPGASGQVPSPGRNWWTGRVWMALWAQSDATYRFSLPSPVLVGGTPLLPTGTFDLQVTNTSGTSLYLTPPPSLPPGPYSFVDQPRLTLPPTAAHPPPVVAEDYLVELPIWPTVAFPVPNGETAVSGQVVSASGAEVDGLRLVLLLQTDQPLGKPTATTDGAGQFLYRLPNLSRPAGSNPQVALSVQIVDSNNNPLKVAPSTLTITAGKLTTLVRLLVP